MNHLTQKALTLSTVLQSSKISLCLTSVTPGTAILWYRSHRQDQGLLSHLSCKIPLLSTLQHKTATEAFLPTWISRLQSRVLPVVADCSAGTQDWTSPPAPQPRAAPQQLPQHPTWAWELTEGRAGGAARAQKAVSTSY